jgi:hypothetical protein
MKNKQPTFSATNQLNFLALCIFVLWSVGIILLPALGITLNPSDFSGSVGWIIALYIALHGVIFIFTSILLWQLISRTRYMKGNALFQCALYIYVLAALATSLYIIIETVLH